MVELCRLLKDMGHKVEVFQPFDFGEAEVSSITKEYDGIKFYMIPDNGKHWQYGANNRLNYVFNELAGGHDFRIYFTTFLAWPQALKPCLSICHGIYFDYITHALHSGYDRDQREEFLRRNLYGFEAPDVCVAVDTNVKRYIQATKPQAAQNVLVIPNFVDTLKFQPAKHGEGRNRPLEGRRLKVLYPRRLTGLRGCNEFFKAIHDFPQYDYVVCGNGSTEEIEIQVGELNQHPNVEVKYAEMDDMPAVYQACDIAVIPTKAAEGLSLSLLEAMACGLPIITTPAGGIGDAFTAGYNGLMVDLDHGDLGVVIHQMASMIQAKPDLAELISQRNRDVARCFDLTMTWRASWERVLESFL